MNQSSSSASSSTSSTLQKKLLEIGIPQNNVEFLLARNADNIAGIKVFIKQFDDLNETALPALPEQAMLNWHNTVSNAGWSGIWHALESDIFLNTTDEAEQSINKIWRAYAEPLLLSLQQLTAPKLEKVQPLKVSNNNNDDDNDEVDIRDSKSKAKVTSTSARPDYDLLIAVFEQVKNSIAVFMSPDQHVLDVQPIIDIAITNRCDIAESILECVADLCAMHNQLSLVDDLIKNHNVRVTSNTLNRAILSGSSAEIINRLLQLGVRANEDTIECMLFSNIDSELFEKIYNSGATTNSKTHLIAYWSLQPDIIRQKFTKALNPSTVDDALLAYDDYASSFTFKYCKPNQLLRLKKSTQNSNNINDDDDNAHDKQIAKPKFVRLTQGPSITIDGTSYSISELTKKLEDLILNYDGKFHNFFNEQTFQSLLSFHREHHSGNTFALLKLLLDLTAMLNNVNGFNYLIMEYKVYPTSSTLNRALLCGSDPEIIQKCLANIDNNTPLCALYSTASPEIVTRILTSRKWEGQAIEMATLFSSQPKSVRENINGIPLQFENSHAYALENYLKFIQIMLRCECPPVSLMNAAAYEATQRPDPKFNYDLAECLTQLNIKLHYLIHRIGLEPDRTERLQFMEILLKTGIAFSDDEMNEELKTLLIDYSVVSNDIEMFDHMLLKGATPTSATLNRAFLSGATESMISKLLDLVKPNEDTVNCLLFSDLSFTEKSTFSKLKNFFPKDSLSTHQISAENCSYTWTQLYQMFGVEGTFKQPRPSNLEALKFMRDHFPHLITEYCQPLSLLNAAKDETKQFIATPRLESFGQQPFFEKEISRYTAASSSATASSTISVSNTQYVNLDQQFDDDIARAIAMSLEK